MMTKAILIVWIGFSQTQTLTLEAFDTMEECLSAKEAIRAFHRRLDGDCIPYGGSQ